VTLDWAIVAQQQYEYWCNNDTKIRDKINQLIDNCMVTPFAGLGKPEALRGNLSGCWSRRISITHRLVYTVTGTAPDDVLTILQCRYHY
jgi:toxin YoeB